MDRATVSLTRCIDYSQGRVRAAIERQFELLGGLGQFVKRGDKVLLKPNLIAPKSRRWATQTDPAVIVEAAKLLIDFGARPFVGDSPAWSNVFSCVRALKLEEALKSLSVPVKQLGKPRKCQVGAAKTRVGISSVALEADVILNLPKFKTHQQLLTTFAVKNMFGVVSGKSKAIWHFAKGRDVGDFCELLIETYKFMNPAVTIIDAVRVMDGPGPIRGRAREFGWLIGGVEPIACEMVCCKLVNIEPEIVPIIEKAKAMGFGCHGAEQIQIVGDWPAEDICTDFELPELIPVRFSLLQVCKSICKQIVLLAKSTAGSKSQL